MSIKVEDMIYNALFTKRKFDDWEEFKNNMIISLLHINFYEIEDYVPCDDTCLYISIQRLRVMLYNRIVSNNSLFIEISAGKYTPRENIKISEIFDMTYQSAEILAEKQTEKTLLNFNKRISVFDMCIKNILYSDIKKHYDNYEILNEYTLDDGIFLVIMDIDENTKIVGIIPVYSDSLYTKNEEFEIKDFTYDYTHFIHTLISYKLLKQL